METRLPYPCSSVHSVNWLSAWGAGGFLRGPDFPSAAGRGDGIEGGVVGRSEWGKEGGAGVVGDLGGGFGPGNDRAHSRVTQCELEGQLRHGAVCGQRSEFLHLGKVLLENSPLLRIGEPVLAEITFTELRSGAELAGEDPHGKRPTHDDADFIFLAVGENLRFREAVEEAVIDLQGRAVAIGVKGFQALEVAGADAIRPDLAVALQLLETGHEDFHVWLAEINMALHEIEMVGLQAPQPGFDAFDQLGHRVVGRASTVSIEPNPPDLRGDHEAFAAAFHGPAQQFLAVAVVVKHQRCQKM